MVNRADRGLAPERTDLARRRTALVLCGTAAALAAVVLRHHGVHVWPVAVVALVGAGAAAALARVVRDGGDAVGALAAGVVVLAWALVVSALV